MPSELIIAKSNLKTVISFSSTTLIYTPIINSKIDVISIYYKVYNYKKEEHDTWIMKEIEAELNKFQGIRYV